MAAIDNNEEKSNVTNNLYKYFDVKYENQIFSIVIATNEKEKNESIILKAYEKSSISKNNYSNSYNYEQLLKMSKAFKMCDNFNEILNMILQKFEGKELSVFIGDNLEIIMDFTLPNKKVDKVKLELFQRQLKESELIEELYANASYLQEKNKKLEKEIKDLKPKTFVEFIGSKFKVSSFAILNDLYKELNSFDLSEDYLKEIENKFQSKIKTIFDSEKDGDTISRFICKVFGKKNLAGYVSSELKSQEENEKDLKTYYGGQAVYFNGKFNFENGTLSFLKNDLFSYGLVGSLDNDPVFTFFRDDNAKVYIRMGKGCVYFLATDSEDRLKMYFKVNDHFLKNPVNAINWDHKDVGPKELIKISDEKYNEIVKNDFDDEKKAYFYIKELKIFELEP